MHTSIRTIRLLLTALALIVFLVSCSQSPYGIFAGIERERAILDDRDLENEINVSAIAKAAGTYFIAAGSLYYRNATDPDYAADDRAEWQKVGAPGTNYTTNSLVSADFGSGPAIFAVYTSQDGTFSGLYEFDPADPTADPVERLTTGESGIESLGKLFVVNDGATHLLVSAEGDGGLADYSLFASADGENFAEIADSSTTYPYIDAASDGTNVAYLTPLEVVIDTDGVLADDGPAAATNTSKGSGAAFTGAMYDSVGGTLWLADDSGHLYSSDDFGTSWSRNSEAHQVSTNNDAALHFSDFAAVPDGSTTTILVGTGGNGYGYRVIGDATTASATTTPSSPDVEGSNYQASDLASTVVQTFFVDPDLEIDYPVPTADGSPYEYFDGYLLFAGTPNQGLWRALSYDGPIQWVRE